MRRHLESRRFCGLAGLFVAVAAVFLMPTTGIAKAPQFLKLTVEGSEFFEGDTLVVLVEATGLEDEIDYVALDSVGERVRETYGTRIAVVDGKVAEVRIRRIHILPNGVGTHVIGPLTAGSVTSNSVAVRVLTAETKDWVPGPDNIRVAARLSRADPYLQSQTVLDLELRHRYPLIEESFDIPAFPGMRSKTVFAERRVLDPKDDGWRVISWRFLLFPERSGPVELASFRAEGTMVKSRRERAAYALDTGPIRLTVRPAGALDSDWWLPASQVRVTDEWSEDPRDLSAGDEIERHIVVHAKGVTAEQIPALSMQETRGLLITPLGNERETTITETGASADARFGFRIRALSPIPVFPDTIRLAWWNVETDKAEMAVLPARRINIGIPDREALLRAIGEEETLFQAIARTPIPPVLSTPAALVVILGLAALLIGAVHRFGRPVLGWIAARLADIRLRRQIRAGAFRDALRSLHTPPTELKISGAGAVLRRALESKMHAADADDTRLAPPVPDGVLFRYARSDRAEKSVLAPL
ncbi:MAG: hypothetical protein AAGL24_04450 [Pseudomonadota bacterium]